MPLNGISLTKGPFSTRKSFAKSIDSLYLQFRIQTRFDFFATLHILLKNLCKSARKKICERLFEFFTIFTEAAEAEEPGELNFTF